MAGLFNELKRRNVVRVGVAYIVVGWVVIQIAEVLFDAFGSPDWVIKTVIVLIGIGFPFAVLFAWAFELTPEGLMKTREVDLSKSITHNTGRKLDFVIIGALVIALGYFIWERQTHEHDAVSVDDPVADIAEESEGDAKAVVSGSVQRSIAVLPFVNMSSDEEQGYFADGLTEEILNSLAKAPDLLVAARTSSFSYKGSSQPIPEIAAALGVDHVLEGSVRRGGETLRITAQLIRAADGFHLWSDTFDRTMEDIIQVQEDIAVQIAKALETTMDPEALEHMMAAGTSSVPAYEAYLTGKGAQAYAEETGDSYEMLNARDAFETAIAHDPEFAQAHWELAQFWRSQASNNLLFSGLTEVPAETSARNRDEAIRNAIRFEKDEISKLRYRAIQASEDMDFRRALTLSAEYLAARPNDDLGLRTLYGQYRNLGLFVELIEVVRERYETFGITRDTAPPLLQSVRTAVDAELGRVIAHDAIDQFGNIALIMYQAHRQLLWAGDIDGASNLVPRLVASDLDEDNRLLVELRQACAEQRTADAKRIHQRLLDDFSEELGIMWLAYEIMGDKESAGRLFDEHDEVRDFETIASYLNYPHFNLHRYPNFMRAVANQGLEDRVVLELPYRCNR